MNEHVNPQQIDAWAWWRNALEGNFGPIHDGDPQQGYYRVRRKGRDIDSAVAYWFDSQTGALRCHMDGQDFDEQRALEIWTHACKKPVSTDEYSYRLREGKWSNTNDSVIGNNQNPVGDDAAEIADRIEDLAREAERMLKVGAATDDASADQASDLANTFSELEGKVTSLHKIEKQPHLDAGRAVDTKWFSLRDRAADLKKRLKAVVVTPWLKKKDEEKQKTAVAAIATGVAPEALPQVRTVAGSSKRSTGLRTVTTANVTDWKALIAHLSEHPKVRETVQDIANASAKAGITLPGMEIKKDKAAA